MLSIAMQIKDMTGQHIARKRYLLLTAGRHMDAKYSTQHDK